MRIAGCALPHWFSVRADHSKKVYDGFRRYLPDEHKFRRDADTFGSRDLRPTPPMREHDEIVRDAAVAKRAFTHFGVKPGSRADPSPCTGVTGESELLRLPYWDHVFMSPMDFMHVFVRALSRSCLDLVLSGRYHQALF